MATTTVRYSDEELSEFKVLIEEKLEKAKQEVQFIQAQMLETNENSNNQQTGDWTDESSNHTQMELLNNTVVRQIQFVRNLENALLRIHNKTYGICIITGQLIDKQRLKLVPHATKSVEGKNARPVHNTANHAVSADAAARRRNDDEPNTDHDEGIATQKDFFDRE